MKHWKVEMVLYASWTHGNSIVVEVPRAYQPSENGLDAGVNVVDIGAGASISCSRLGWATRFDVHQSRQGDGPVSGNLWCHVAVPTPVVVGGTRAQADTVMVNWESSNALSLFVAAVHVWDGNRRIFVDGRPSAGDFTGGVIARSTDPTVVPNLNLMYRGNLNRKPVYLGVSVSLRIRASDARHEFLEVRSIGVDFDVPS